MQLVELNLSHYNFYCPVTGVKIFSEGEQHFSPAVLGLWVQEIANEPEIKNSELEQAWLQWVAANEDNDDFCWDVAEFLDTLEQSNWVAFQIQTGGSLMPETVTVLIDMDATESFQ
jgi:hypothetical protein